MAIELIDIAELAVSPIVGPRRRSTNRAGDRSAGAIADMDFSAHSLQSC
jgi:hypothetical protein